ncbi:DUF4091 domain-containing protein [Microbacterium esteraromaticum]|uniref:DUF4091 domain-containing protein n=1 Tax=Microbacterium esteraromaticum TaxID=57043 RepID=UPI001CD4D947|nr:DUF4091 domain-containing protein [Microbacterium esteraromaticum]MCA1306693.1 DUF4091 domain-containing protein [Microbacterium esteraromaticum]
MTPHSTWQTVLCDSLEKVFPDQAPRPFTESVPLVAYRGQLASFQIAVRPPRLRESTRLGDVELEIVAPPGLRADVSVVDLVPNDLAAFEDADEGYLRTGPGLFPDLLRPAPHARLQPVVGQWRALWVDVIADAEAASGDQTVLVRVHSLADECVIGEFQVPVRVPSVELAPLEIAHTEWFHCDGLADYYGFGVFSEPHWAAIENFLESAVRAGVNTILTPVWTAALDTGVTERRTPTQLLRIIDRGDEQYEFDFSGVRRWMTVCRKVGIRNLEIVHLFTQWGARATPPMIVDTPEGPEQRFGWHVPADDARYRRLLEQMLPALRQVLDEEWGLDRVFFHVSDEPTLAHLESFATAWGIVADLLEGCTVIDALAELELHSKGLVALPIVSNDHADAFLDAGVPSMWLYYCVAQSRRVANRFMALPSSRSRVLGAQLYLTGAEGFLHWGFNFYNSFLSRRRIDPFRDTTAGSAFLGGDAFLVYPGPEGRPWESIRHRVVAEAFVDHRAMAMLARCTSDENVRAIVDPSADLTLTSFPADPDHYRRVAVALADGLVDAAGSRSSDQA